MKAIVVGCGRVGSAVALQLLASGWDVTVLDENEDALGRLGDSWAGGFVVGHGMDLQLLREAGIEEADAVVVTTDGDNTNLVIAQGAQKHFQVPTVDYVLRRAPCEVLIVAFPQSVMDEELAAT